MKMTAIAAVNFMAGTFNHVLGSCTLITGKNRKGKTRIQKAAQLALAGFVPGIGRRNGDIYDDLGNGQNLCVMASFGDVSMRREWQKGTRNSISVNSIPHGLPDNWSVPAVLISAKEYFELGSKDRINFLFSAMDLSTAEFSVEKLLAGVKNIKLDENTEHTEKVIRDITDEIISGDQLREHSEQSLQTWLDELSTTLEKKLSDATAAVKRMDGTVKGLIEIGAQSQATPVAASVEGELVQARKDLADSEAEVRRLEQSAKVIGQNQARKTQIETELGKPHKNGKKEKQAELDKHRETIAAYHEGNHQTAQQILDKINAELTGLTKEREMLEKQISDADKENKKVMEHVVCPCCDSEGTEWRERVQKKHDKFIKAVKQRVADNATKFTRATTDKTEAAKIVGQFEEFRKASQQSALKITGVQREIAAIEREEDTIASLRRELAGLENVGTAGDKTAAIETRDKAQARVTELEGKNNQLIQERAQVAAQAQAVENAKLNIAEKKVTKLALEIVMTAKDKLTEQTIKPLLAVANAICQPLLDQPLEYIDGQIGWTVPGTKKFQSHVTFCGAEEAIVFSALQVALALRSPIKIVMIDELGVIDYERKIALVLLMRDLVKNGKLDQFIGNDTTDEDYMRSLGADDVTDFTFIRL